MKNKQNDLTEKEALKNYIIRQLGRTDKKNYENYCITRIYHLLNRSDVQFVTQQMFKRADGKIALADLYFPQIDFWVEIDEVYHSVQEGADRKRTEEVLIKNKQNHFEEIINVKQEPWRIEISNKSLEEINKQIDKIVKRIEQKISKLGKNFIPWKTLYEKPEYYIEKGYLDTKDKPAFRTLQEVSELFNKGYGTEKGGSQQSWFADKPNSKIAVWCPKLKFDKSDKGKWDNFITSDGKTIYEYSSKENFNLHKYLEKYEEGYKTRYTFAKFRDSSGRDLYRFRGVFKLNRKKTEDQKKVVWEKNDDKINLRKYFDK